MVGRPSLRSGSGRETFLEVREWSGGPPEGLGVFVRPSRRSGSGREWSGGLLEVREWSEALKEVREWSEVVGRPSRRSGSDRKALPEVRELSGRPTGGLEVVGRPS